GRCLALAEGDLRRLRFPRSVLPRPRGRGVQAQARRGRRERLLLRALRRDPFGDRVPLPEGDRLPRGAALVILGAAGLAAAALICLDPGHGTPPAVGRQVEPIGPGSKVMKIKDGGGASGEAGVALAIARRTRSLLLARGYRVAMTRTGPTFRYGTGGNIARAQFCNRRHAALMVRIHADGSQNTSLHGISTLVPAWHRGWTNDIYGPSLRAGRMLQRALVSATGAADRGLVPRSDLTG